MEKNLKKEFKSKFKNISKSNKNKIKERNK